MSQLRLPPKHSLIAGAAMVAGAAKSLICTILPRLSSLGEGIANGPRSSLDYAGMR